MIIYRWWGGVCDRVCLFSGLRKCLFKEFHKKGLLTDFGFDLKLEVTLRVNLNLDLGFFRKCTCKIIFRFMKPAQFCSYHRAPVTESVIQNHHWLLLPSATPTVRLRWELNIRGGAKFNTEGLLPTWLNKPSSNKHCKDKEHDKKKTHHYYIFLKF